MKPSAGRPAATTPLHNRKKASDKDLLDDVDCGNSKKPMHSKKRKGKDKVVFNQKPGPRPKPKGSLLPAMNPEDRKEAKKLIAEFAKVKQDSDKREVRRAKCRVVIMCQLTNIFLFRYWRQSTTMSSSHREHSTMRIWPYHKAGTGTYGPTQIT